MSNGFLFNIQKFSTNDGPGIRTTVFFKGCPLHCYWCSNPESQSARPQLLWDAAKCVHCEHCMETCPAKAISQQDGLLSSTPACTGCGRCVQACPQKALTLEGKPYTVEEVLRVCLQDRDFYEESGGGVTLSGGEPLAQPDFAVELLQALKAHGLHTAIETTGFAPEETFARLLPFLDLYLFDCKQYDSEAHKGATGVSNDLIARNLKAAIDAGKQVIIRIPVIPGFNDALEDAAGFCAHLKSLGAKDVNLLPFHQFGEKKYEFLSKPYLLHDAKALHESDLQDYQSIFLENGFHCYF